MEKALENTVTPVEYRLTLEDELLNIADKFWLKIKKDIKELNFNEKIAFNEQYQKVWLDFINNSGIFMWNRTTISHE